MGHSPGRSDFAADSTPRKGQWSVFGKRNGAPKRSRTSNLSVRSRMLYPLSYGRASKAAGEPSLSEESGFARERGTGRRRRKSKTDAQENLWPKFIFKSVRFTRHFVWLGIVHPPCHLPRAENKRLLGRQARRGEKEFLAGSKFYSEGKTREARRARSFP